MWLCASVIVNKENCADHLLTILTSRHDRFRSPKLVLVLERITIQLDFQILNRVSKNLWRVGEQFFTYSSSKSYMTSLKNNFSIIFQN